MVTGCYGDAMRTTLDIDPIVLSAARSKAAAEGISLGKAISEMALASLSSRERQPNVDASGFPVMHGVPGHIVTDEMVAQYRDDRGE